MLDGMSRSITATKLLCEEGELEGEREGERIFHSRHPHIAQGIVTTLSCPSTQVRQHGLTLRPWMTRSN